MLHCKPALNLLSFILALPALGRKLEYRMM